MLPDDPNERLSWIHPPYGRGWDFLIAHRSNHLWAVFHDNYTISSSSGFGQVWKYRGRTHATLNSSSMLMEPGEFHRTISVPPDCTFKVAFIPASDVESAAEELDISGSPHIRRAATDDPRLTDAVLSLGLAVEKRHCEPLEIHTMQARIIQLLLGYAERIPRSFGRAQEDHRAVARVKSYLHDMFYAHVTLDELSKIAGLSRFRLVHAFTETVGLSPHAYQIQIRVEKARQLIRHGVLGAQLAVSLGFSDQAHFIRHFKRIMKVTPGEYKRTAYVRVPSPLK